MTPLDILFLVSAATLVVALLFGRMRFAGPVLVLLYAAQFWSLFQTNTLFGDPVTSSWLITIRDQPMSWDYSALSWFFAMIVIGVGFVSALYAAGSWMEKYLELGGNGHAFHVVLATNILSMLVLLGASDFLTLFLGLELVGWSGFLLMAIAGGIATKAALKYLTYAFSGAMAILGAMVLLYAQVGSLQYGPVIEAIPSMTNGQIWTLLLLMGGGFAVKMGLLPFHLWQPQAYAEAPGPGSAFLGAILARMGLYDFIVVFISMVGVTRLVQLEVPYTSLSSRDLLAWVAAFTIILPTYTALRQHDARYLLIWLGIGQGGFMLLGLMVGNAVGIAGTLSHVLYFAATQAALLMAVFAVMYRAGTSDLNRTGGFATRMPLSFLVVLFGVFSLVGLPPTAGYVSKWFVYRSLLSEGMLLLFMAAVIGTLGAVLSSYKLVHYLFLGRLRNEHVDVREAPASMLTPMLALTVMVVLAGLMPGPVLSWIAAVQAQLGLPVVDHHPGGFTNPYGSLDIIWITSMLIGVCGVGVIAYFGLGGRSKRPHQKDDHTVDERLYAEKQYLASDSLYAGLMRLIGPLYRAPFALLERAVVSSVDFFARGVGSFYHYEQPILLLLAAAVTVAAWAV